MKRKLFAVKSPSGVLLWDTFASSREAAWDRAYWAHLYSVYRHYADGRREAYRKGWRCVQVKIVEEA